jgi:hypothetical protein
MCGDREGRYEGAGGLGYSLTAVRSNFRFLINR